MDLLKKETILVTGATGLVGAHLLTMLKDSDVHIKALCRNIPVDADSRHQWVACDLLDVVSLDEAMKGVDKIYHCAGLVSFDPKRKHEIFKINFEGTANVVNAAINNQVKKLLHVSSVAAIGEGHGKKLQVHEELSWEENRASDYGKSKHWAEMEVWRGICEGLPAVIINPSVILGCSDWHKGSAELFKTVYDEFPWYTEGVHGFVDVQDVAKAAILLMNSSITAQRYIINGENISYKDLFIKIANAFGKRPPYKKVSALTAEIVWRVKYLKGKLTGRPSILNKNTVRAALSVVEYNNEKLQQALPAFTYTKIDESIARIGNELQRKYNL